MRKPLDNRQIAAAIEKLSAWDQCGYALWLVHEREGEVIAEYETTGSDASVFFISNGGWEAAPYDHLASGFDTPLDADGVYYARRIAR
jgi:hypothetical protein